MKLILLATGLIGLAFAGIAIKIWGKKNGEFAGTCASNNPLLKNDEGSCTVCGARPTEQCQKD
ncbi:MAG: membrane or secreted protein [Salibacteraceae bacterium]